MRKSISIYAMFMASAIVACMTSCEPKALTVEDVFVNSTAFGLEKILDERDPQGWDFYDLNDFKDKFMTEEGSFHNDTTPYRERSYNADLDVYMFSVDTIPAGGKGIYIRGRIATDDYGGNFYKSMVIQQIVDGKQQNLRISVDLGSSAGMYQLGQEIVVRCNGLCIGRYANQPQLCTPAYNNNIYAMSATEKIGWAPGRIQGSVFRSATYMVDGPRPDLLRYDTLTLAQLFSEIKRKPTDSTSVANIRKNDGRLIVVKNVSFSGLYDDNGTLKECTVGHPDTVGGSNVFAPSTQNIGYPQSRLLCDAGAGSTVDSLTKDQTTLMCSNSEYAKFAYFYLPGADKTGIAHCRDFVGTVTGILGWYEDKASEICNKQTGREWSITPRGIRGPEDNPSFGLNDIKMHDKKDASILWQPKEYDPNDL